MPMVNGKFERTFGQGYAKAKANQPPEMSAPHTDEAHSESEGAEMHIKANQDGSFETKSKRKGEKGSVEEKAPETHDNAEMMKEHVDSHFAEDSHEPEEHQGDGDEEEAGGNALKSILSE